MRTFARIVALAGLAGAVATGQSQAADVAAVAPAFEEVPVSNWYLRGFIGMTNQEVKKIDNVLFSTGYFEFLNEPEFDSGVLFGGGVGYRFNPWFRTDVTGEYRGKTKFSAFDRYDFNDDGIWDGSNDYSANKSEWLFLANAYVDFGAWRGITPYVGAGIGASRNTISDFVDINAPVNGQAYAASDSKWNLAWALHAGLGWAVTEAVTIDLAYRYVNLGDGQTGDVIAYDGTNNVYNPLYFEDITSHDILFGLRYNFM